MLTGSALLAAEGLNCLEMSASLPNGYTLYFCIQLSGGQVLPWYLPTWPEGFLGNSVGGTPFYTNIPGDPALYQRVEGSKSTISFSDISVVSPTGIPATGWEAVSADAESTDQGESITWTSDVTEYIIPNGEAGQTQPVGNACLNNGTSQSTTPYTDTPGLTGGWDNPNTTGASIDTVECSGGTTETGNEKTGTAMIGAFGPSTMTISLVGTGLEAITFGMQLP